MSDTTLAVIFQPIFPAALVGLIVLCAATLAVWTWSRSRGVYPRAAALGLAMRLLAIGSIGFLLLGPSELPSSDSDPTRTPVHLLVDASGSMQTVDMQSDGNKTSRYGFALDHWLSDHRLAKLREHHDVRVYSFGDRARAGLPEPDQATHRVSNLAESTYELVASMNPGDATPNQGATLVVLSDGRDSRSTNPAPATQLAQARNIKVHTVTLGGATLARDLSLLARPRQPYLMVNEPGQIDVRLEQVNASGDITTLRIRHDGQETTQPVALSESPSQTIELPVEHAEPGLYAYEISVDALPDEAETNNNTQTVFIEVTAERMRVLLLEGQPYWDTKFLAQSLRKDDRIELTQITQIRKDSSRPETIVTRVDEQPKVPKTYEDLARYDVVVLGRGMQHVLSTEAASALPRYVSERGGRVVLARGRPYDAVDRHGGALAEALSVIEPVVWGTGVRRDQPWNLTDAGRAHPVFARLIQAVGGVPSTRDLPTFERVNHIDRLKPATRVLATSGHTTTNNPDASNQDSALVVMPYGRGMVVGILGEGLWRWSLATSNNQALAGVYDAFWSNMVRWLVLGGDAGPGKDVSLRLSGRSVALDDELTVTLIQRGQAVGLDPPTVSVISPAGKTTTLRPTARSGSPLRQVATFSPETEGVHTVRVSPSPSVSNPDTLASTTGPTPENANSPSNFEAFETKFTAYDGNTEMLRIAADPVLMRKLASDTNGQAFDPADPDALLQVLANERAARLVPPTPRFIWDRGWIMAALLGWLGLEWLLRKKGGLI